MIQPDQEPAIRSTERTVVVEHLFERVFRELRGYQVVMQHSLVEESVAMKPLRTPFNECQNKQVRATKLDLEMNIKAQLDPFTNDMAVADRVCCPCALVQKNIGGQRWVQR